MMTEAPSDRRRFPRAQVSFDVDVRVDVGGKHERSSGRLIVLSAGGAFLALDDGYPMGTFLRVQFKLVPIGEIARTAIVRRAVDGTGAAVEFLDLSDPQERRILAFIAKHEA